MADNAGFKTYRGPHYRLPLYHRPAEKPKAVDPEAVAANAKKSQDGSNALLREQAGKWGVAPEDVDLWIDDPVAYAALIDHRKDQARIAAKLADREARIAVEGDTDSNHDNLEGGE